MPCHYDPTPQELAEMQAEKTKAIVKPYLKKIDDLTRMLCSLCKYVDDFHDVPVNSLNNCGDIKKELIVWWEQHQANDKKQREDKKAKALAKLTKEEQVLLGLLKKNVIEPK